MTRKAMRARLRRQPRRARLTDEHHAILLAAQNGGLTGAQRVRVLGALAPLWERRDVAAALAAHDIASVYRVLGQELQISQRSLAVLTEQSQSEISEILCGRQVRTYPLLLRIATGLGIPRWRMGLSAEPPARTRRRANRETDLVETS